jgi:hypothetical protein
VWFLGRTRGTELIRKTTALQNFGASNETFKQLYGILTILDTKATGLLTVDALLIAACVVFIGSAEQTRTLIGFAIPSRLIEMQLAALAVSAFLCLLVVRVSWRFMEYVPDAPTSAVDFDNELRRLANVVDDRTRYYWFAWLFALIGFVLTLAWWQWWYALIGYIVVILWSRGRG